MNISQMMKGLLGDAVSGDARTMELKVGQVVRGVVLQSLENNEALIQINGVQVRAKLEMPLVPGQSAMLQVQPESSGALIVLKAVDLSASGLLDDTFRDLAKLLGMPDQRWALDIVKDLRREGFLFDKTTAKAFQQAASAMPQGADLEQWMAATAATFKRGLPMTTATIASMGQALFGKGTHELLDSLQRHLSAFLPAGDAASATEGESAQQAAVKVLQLLEQGSALLRSGLSPREGAAVGTNGNTAMTSTAASAAPKEGLHTSSQSAAQVLGQSMEDTGMAATVGGRGAAAQVNASNWLGGMMKWLGVDHEHQLAKAATAGDANNSSAVSQPRTAAADGGVAARNVGAGGITQPNAAQAQGLTAGQGPGKAGFAGMVENTDGAAMDHPGRNAASQSSMRGDGTAQAAASDGRAIQQAQPSGALLQPNLNAEGGRVENTPSGAQNVPVAQVGAAQSESLKSALLALAQASDTPPAIKETAQQLVHQITGQQLLLTPERNSSVFTHVTMFIPLQDQNGGTTASVHIQTRRGKRGELDADNCRLLFNLSMTSLGDTLVDVNVTDKIVSLNIWNDHPAIAELIESSRNEIAERLQGTGYQLLSLRATPLRNREEQAADDSSVMEKGKRQLPPDLAQFASTRYKGVDYRI